MNRIRRVFCLSTVAWLVLAGSVPAASLVYTLEQDSKVSIAIYDGSGQIVRQLLLAEPRRAGEHTETWNGLNDRGKPVPPGKYPWKLLSSQGLRAEWMVSLGSGLNPGYQIMPGNHVGAVNVTLGENGDLFIMGGCSECVPGMARIDRGGKVLWHSGDLLESNNDCGSGLADGMLFTMVGNAKVLAIDPATGRGLWKATTEWNDVKQVWLPGSRSGRRGGHSAAVTGSGLERC